MALIVKSLHSASYKGVPIFIYGSHDSSVYSSSHKLTKSTNFPNTFIVPVSRCFECSASFL